MKLQAQKEAAWAVEEAALKAELDALPADATAEAPCDSPQTSKVFSTGGWDGSVGDNL